VIRLRGLLVAIVTAYRQPAPVNDTLTSPGQHIVDLSESGGGVMRVAKKSKKSKKDKKSKKGKK
jgi:uncharacterized protein (DUF2249 family)